MNWSDVGDWIKKNAGSGAALVGSLLTGNVPGAVAAGVSLVSGATGTNEPDKAVEQLKSNPDALLKLKKLYFDNEASIRKHVEEMTRLELEDSQKAQEQQQMTIRSGDNAEDVEVRRTRPRQAWFGLCSAVLYVFWAKPVDHTVLGILMALPFGYHGLREFGKGSFGTMFKK